MNEQLLKQIESEMFTEITGLLKTKGNDIVSGLYAMSVLTDFIESYKNKLMEKKEYFGLDQHEVNEIIDEASVNILPRILEGSF